MIASALAKDITRPPEPAFSCVSGMITGYRSVIMPAKHPSLVGRIREACQFRHYGRAAVESDEAERLSNGVAPLGLAEWRATERRGRLLEEPMDEKGDEPRAGGLAILAHTEKKHSLGAAVQIDHG